MKDNDGKFAIGKFRIRDRHHPAVVGDLIVHLKNCGAQWAAENSSVIAISKIARVESFDPKRLKQKAKTHYFLLEKQRNIQDYLNLFEEVYNYKVQGGSKLNLAFLAQESADARRIQPFLRK